MTDCAKPEKDLLTAGEPGPVGSRRPVPGASWIFLCEHAGKRMPLSLKNLGLPRTEINRHIGWDIGALAVAEGVADRLDAPLFYQRYSRLVIDCNRPLASPELIPEKSEDTVIPGNRNLPAREREKRIKEIWQPYQETIRDYLEKAVSRPVLVSMHSFTPVFRGVKRPWDIGLLFNRRPETALALKRELIKADSGLAIGMNQPYTVSDGDDYTIPEFGEATGLPHVLVEIRQDLIDTGAARFKWVDLMTRACLGIENELLRG